MKSRKENKKPDWVPDNAGKAFATSVVPGIRSGHDGMSNAKPAQKKQGNKIYQVLELNDYIHGIKMHDRFMLARAITLIESNAQKHIEIAQEVLHNVLPLTGNSVRIGITGSPGAGKSTLIEALGMYLCSKGHKVAVLAIDPSSTRTGGSILGDKTRMDLLSRQHNAFIRPSPSGGTLGGVARKTRESILLCEAAGFDTILIETVGVGQSEVTVRSMVDFFMLIMLPGAGDELQGIKKGSVELADGIVVNKADGENINFAQLTKSHYEIAVHYLMQATEGWNTQVKACSALNGSGIEDLWNMVDDFCSVTKASGEFTKRRNSQVLDWVHSMIEEKLKEIFYRNENVSALLHNMEKSLLSGEITATEAYTKLIESYVK